MEDDPDARELMVALLEGRGARVTTASSADEGLASLRRVRPDLLISDLGMPGKDGLQLVRELRRLPAAEGGATPAIALTGFVTEQDRAISKLAGFQVHLAKPLDFDIVVSAVRSLLTARAIPSAATLSPDGTDAE